MAAIPITFHSQLVPNSIPLRQAPLRPPIYFTVSDRPQHKKASQRSQSINQIRAAADTRQGVDEPSTSKTPQTSSQTALPSSSGTSSTSTTPKPAACRRKPTTTTKSPSISDPSKGYITLKPLNSAIVDSYRSHTQTTNQSSTPISPKKLTNGKSTIIPQPVPFHIKTSIQGNDRSPNPSPREILRAQKAEEEKARTKKDSVAAARAAIALKRKKGKSNAKAGRNGLGLGMKGAGAGAGGNMTRSPSPIHGEIPSNTATSASNPTSSALVNRTSVPAPKNGFPESSRVPLKRTRSTGLSPIFPSVANALGVGNLGVGSPLKAVTGPLDTKTGEDVDAEVDADGERRSKRSRTTEPVTSSDGPAINGRKTSLSSEDVLDIPVSGQLKGLYPGGRLAPPTSESLGNNGTTSSNGTGMRRAVSQQGTSTGGMGTGRRGSSGSQGSGSGQSGVTSMRSRREVNLPRALRDYEMRPGTTA